MEQEIQPQQPNSLPSDNKNKMTVIVAVSVLVTAIIIGSGIYFWQKTASEKIVNRLEQKISSLEQEISTIKNLQNTPPPTPQVQETPTAGTKSFTIPEVGIKASFPNSYSLLKNNEQNRRGSFVSYDFQQSGNYQTPSFYELQFFSEESIRNFTKSCEDTMCFEGDYPDLTRYSGQKTAFAQGKDYQSFKLQKFGTRNWFVSSHRCSGDSCVIREYTTFLGNTKLDAWIMMGDSTEEKQADTLFAQFKIE